LDNVDTKSKSKLGEIVVSHDKSLILKKSKMSVNLNTNIESDPSKTVRSDPPFICASDEIDSFLKKLFEFFNEQFNKQNHPKYVAQLIKKYIGDLNKNPAKVLIMMLKHKHDYLASLIGLFYQFGIGTLVDSQIALEMYSQVIGNLKIKETPPESCEISSRLISEFSTGFMYLFGTGVEQDQAKAFQIFSKLSNEGFALAKAYLGECFERGY
ncbi:8561_t:CDS:2, partial [Acaulospora morrowiae]